MSKESVRGKKKLSEFPGDASRVNPVDLSINFNNFTHRETAAVSSPINAKFLDMGVKTNTVPKTNTVSGFSPFSSAEGAFIFYSNGIIDHRVTLRNILENWNNDTYQIPRLITYQLLHAHNEHLREFNIDIKSDSAFEDFLYDIALVLSAKPESSKLLAFTTHFIRVKVEEIFKKKVENINVLELVNTREVFTNILKMETFINYISRLLVSHKNRYIKNGDDREIQKFNSEIQKLENISKKLQELSQKLVLINKNTLIELFDSFEDMVKDMTKSSFLEGQISLDFDQNSYDELVSKIDPQTGLMSSEGYTETGEFPFKSYYLNSKIMFDYLGGLDAQNQLTEAKGAVKEDFVTGMKNLGVRTDFMLSKIKQRLKVT